MNVKKIVLILITTILFLSGYFFNILPAKATLTEYQDSPGVTLYNSKHSLKDKQGYSWQIVLFPVISQQKTNYNLRLVGFPGVVEFSHPYPLEIITSEGKVLMANDLFAEQFPAPNVGQYDVTNILTELPSNGSLKIILPLNNNEEISLKIPTPILLEWQWLVKEI